METEQDLLAGERKPKTNPESVELLRYFIKQNSLSAEILEFKDPVESAKEAAKKAHTSNSVVCKSIVFIAPGDEAILVILPGAYKVSRKKLAQALGISSAKLTIAAPTQVLEATGYEVGGVPPIGVYIKAIIDPKALEKKYVIAGGGDDYHLIKILTEELKTILPEAEIADVVKEEQEE